MTQDAKTERAERIAAAAYALLEEQGYGGMSMLKIARRAKASNETLYRWYGDKNGLFKMLIETNAAQVRQLLQEETGDATSPQEKLAQLGPKLLALLLGDRAVALNRAAAGDASGALAQVLAQSGRAAVMPLVENLFGHLARDMAKPTAKAAFYADIYLRLLVGDLQIRRVSGGLPEPAPAALAARAQQAQKMVLQLMQ